MTIRVGLVGVGGFARDAYLPALKAQTGIEVTLLCGRSPERLETVRQQWAEKARIEVGVDGLVRALQDDVVDGVIVVVPDRWHAQMVRPVLEAGRHVLCEKPMTIDVEGARALWELARQTGTVAMMGFTNRYTLAVRRAYELLREGVLGEVALLSMEMHWGGGRTLGWREDGTISPGGIWFDGGSHMIDTVGVLLGDLTVTGLATSTVRRDDGARPTNPDVAAVSGMVAPGRGWGQLLPPAGVGRPVPITGVLSRVDRVASDEVRIVGSDGALAFSLGRGQFEWLDIWASVHKSQRVLAFQDDEAPGSAPPAVRRMVEAWTGAITAGRLSEWDADFEIGFAVQERLASVWPGGTL